MPSTVSKLLGHIYHLTQFIEWANQRRPHFLNFFQLFASKRGWKRTYAQTIVTLPFCLYIGSALGVQLTGYCIHQWSQTFLALSQHRSQVIGYFRVSGGFINIRERRIFCPEQFGMSLRPETPSVSAPTGKENSQEPSGYSPQCVIRYLKCAGWYLGHHLWLFPLGWAISASFGYLLAASTRRRSSTVC